MSEVVLPPGFPTPHSCRYCQKITIAPGNIGYVYDGTYEFTVGQVEAGADSGCKFLIAIRRCVFSEPHPPPSTKLTLTLSYYANTITSIKVSHEARTYEPFRAQEADFVLITCPGNVPQQPT